MNLDHLSIPGFLHPRPWRGGILDWIHLILAIIVIGGALYKLYEWYRDQTDINR